MRKRKKLIGVIGPNASACTEEIYHFGIALGKALVDEGYVIVNGGMKGIMEAVFKGAHQSEAYTFGTTVAIIPHDEKEYANEYADIVIPTGIGIARNQVIVNTADIIVAVAGGAGTLSELAFAWQKGKSVVCATQFGGWAQALAGKQLDKRRTEQFGVADNLADILQFLKHND
ncbi:TIGR00725 family protein [Limibacter armeniacum]|uniref:TIGR00725 family protein n=1 Tax=Limibacter armeniacum TaxID=466084 RepID=UPI002FE5228C